MKKITLIFGLLIWTILICFIPGLLWSKEFKFPLQKEFTLKKPLDLELDDPRGEIILESHNQNKIIIQAFKIVEATNSDEADDLAKRIRIDIEKTGSLVRIKTKYQKAEKGSFLEKLFSVKKSVGGYVSYHILVPKERPIAEAPSRPIGYNCDDNPPPGKLGGGYESESNDHCSVADYSACEYAYCGDVSPSYDEDWWEITVPDNPDPGWDYCVEIEVWADDTPGQYAYGGQLVSEHTG